MKTKLIILFVLSLMVANLIAQQTPMYTQYMLNDFAYNPAIAGTKEYYQAKSNNRYQWIGITDAPRTYVLSVFGPHRKYDMGYGGLLINDITGPTSKLGIYGSYAYNVKIKDGLRFSSGLSLGLLQYKIDGNKITLHDEGDVSMAHEMYVAYIPDATMGIYFYSNKYSAGIAVNQLFGTKVDFKNLEEQELNRLKQHITFHGSYLYEINNDFSIEPFLLIKFVSPAPIQFDINARVIYRNMFWGGIGFRTKDAASILIGYNYQDQLIFGYSYDLTFSDLRKYSSGTHELMIGAKFNKIKENRWRAKLD